MQIIEEAKLAMAGFSKSFIQDLAIIFTGFVND